MTSVPKAKLLLLGLVAYCLFALCSGDGAVVAVEPEDESSSKIMIYMRLETVREIKLNSTHLNFRPDC